MTSAVTVDAQALSGDEAAGLGHHDPRRTRRSGPHGPCHDARDHRRLRSAAQIDELLVVSCNSPLCEVVSARPPATHRAEWFPHRGQQLSVVSTVTRVVSLLTNESIGFRKTEAGIGVSVRSST